MFNNNGSFLLALFEFFLFFAWFMCLFFVLGDIFRSKDIGGGAKTLWVLFVIFIPWLGILVYLIVRGHGMQERQIEQAQAMQKAQNDYVRSVATASTSSGRPNRFGQGPVGQRCDHPGRVRPNEGEGPRHLICSRSDRTRVARCVHSDAGARPERTSASMAVIGISSWARPRRPHRAREVLRLVRADRRGVAVIGLWISWVGS